MTAGAGAADLGVGATVGRAAPEAASVLAGIRAIDEHPGRPLVVDLEGVDLIDSGGLGGAGRRPHTREGPPGRRPAGAHWSERHQGARAHGLTRAFEIHPARAAALSVGK